MKPVPKRHSKAASLTAGSAKPQKVDEPFHSVMARSDELSTIFKMLSNPHRLGILFFLAARERTVSEIETTLKIRQPTLSQQLGELRQAALIVRRRVAKSAIYALTGAGGDLAVRLAQALQGSSGVHVAPVNLPPVVPKSLPAAMFATVRSPTVAFSDRYELTR